MKFLQKRSVLRYITVPAAAAALSLTALVVPASAHDVLVLLQDLGAGGIQNNHRTFFACDLKADGFGIRTAYSGGFVHDGNGSADGCGSGARPTGVTKFRVCATDSNVVFLCTPPIDI